MTAAIVIEVPLNLEPVSRDSFIADLEPRPRDAPTPPEVPVQRGAVAPRRGIHD